jgi:hypothetical protein
VTCPFNLALRPKAVVCERKLLLGKYFHIKQYVFLIKNGCNKKESDPLLRMRNEWNRSTSVRGN